jgi:glycerophosphoryl diester phosphodiesterase
MVKNYAHRGFSGEYPENTMLAFKKALEVGCDGIELDVHLSKDGEIVIIHDEKLERTTDATGLVGDYTYDELKKFNAAKLFKGENERIPTLREYFELVKDKDIITIIELKTNFFEYENLEQKVNDLINEYNLEKNIMMCSFNHRSMVKMKKLNPNLKCALLMECWLIDAGKYTKSIDMDCLHPLFYSMTKDRVKEAKENNVEINVWTVNDEEDMKQMILNGVDGLITNYPNKVNKIRESL